MAGEEKQHAGLEIQSENEDAQTIANSVTESYTLEALKVIREAQQQHGLRHGDFQRYRQYCARRIRRLRKTLHFNQGMKNRVQPKKITTEILKDVKYLHLPLMDAERAWATAMQLKSEANTEPRKRFHMLSRLRKALQHADLLVKLCESNKCDARTKLEAQAYCAWMKGTYYFELEKWVTAMEMFSNAKTIYEKLAGAFVDEVKDIYIQKVEEISPNIRYCAYNIGDESAIKDLQVMRAKAGREDPLTFRLDELIEKTREKQAAMLSEVTWRGRTVPVKNEHVRVFLLSIQDSEQQLNQADTIDSKLSIYESLLKELIEAQQGLKEELKDNPTFKAIIRGQQVEGKVPNSVYLHTYLTYLKLTKTVSRNLLMAESLRAQLEGSQPSSQISGRKQVKPQDVARLYDVVVQNLVEIPNLPGLEEDETIKEEIDAQAAGYKAYRCFFIAKTYEAAKKWREATALYERVLSYVDEAIKSYKAVRGSPIPVAKDISCLEILIKEVDGLKYSCRSSSLLDTDDITRAMGNVSLKNNKLLVDRLEDYFEDSTLASKRAAFTHFPPDFQPVPCKPLFFDLALSLVQFPSLDDRVEQKVQSGITGLVKGWLWGGKK